MEKWLSTPEVLEFFGDVNSPFTVEQVKRKYEPRINDDTSWLMELKTSSVVHEAAKSENE